MKKQLLYMLTAVMLLSFPLMNFAQAPAMGTVASFVLFSTDGAVTNGGVLSQLTGNVGTNVGSSTGFGNVNGVMHDHDGASGTCAADLLLLYGLLNSAIATSFPAPLLGNGDTLIAGVYSISGVATLSSDLYLDAQGDPNAVFIFQMDAAFSTNTASKIILINGAQACNVFWKVEGAISMADATVMRGTVIANNAAITMSINDTLEGRALSIAGAVTVNGILAYTPIGCLSPVLTGPAAPALTAAACYVLFSSNGDVTNAGITHATGDIGTNVGLTTGFDPLDVNGTIHPIPDGSTAACAAALLNAEIYLNALAYDIELLYPAQFGHNLVLTPHTYLMNAAAALTDSLYLNAEDNANGVFVIQINGALTTSTFAKVILINGTQSKNVYWIVNGAVTINDYSVFNGTIVSNNGAISLNTGVTLNGRALTTNGLLTTAAITANGPTAADCSIIPVNWLSFNAEKNSNGSVSLRWSTTGEIGNDHFDIQRSNDAGNFTNLGAVPSGTDANAVQYYAYTDMHAMNGNNFYRLKQVDRDGYYKYSAIVQVNITGAIWSVFPNPATVNTTVQIHSRLNNVAFTLIDENGKTVYYRSSATVYAGESINIPLTNCSKGMYLLKIESNEGNRTSKIFVQ